MIPNLTKLAALAMLAGTGTAAFAQTAVSNVSGGIQGRVLTSDGKPIGHANIYYGRSARVNGKAVAAVLPPILLAKAALDGSFSLSNLSSGSWIVCVEASGYLDPCHWSTAPAYTVAAGQTIPNATIVLDQAYALQVRINDPQGLLASEGKVAGAVLQIGVKAPSGAFQRAVLNSANSAGRYYTIPIPLKAAATLFVAGGTFQLSDDSGTQVATGGKATAVAAPSASVPGASAPPTFTITGLGKP